MKNITRSLILLGAFLVPKLAAAQLTIMPLGDSLTWGFDGASSAPAYLDSLDDGGYRSPLYSLLSGDGIDVNYVGVNDGNPSPVLTAAGQTSHNGFNGYTINEIEGNLDGSVPSAEGQSNLGGYWLTGGGGTNRDSETADVVLLQIGANDILQAIDPAFTGTPGTEYDSQFTTDETLRLESLINEIRTLEPGATILVDGTTPLLDGTNETFLSKQYDSDVKNLILTGFQGDNVDYVDMYDAIMNGVGSAGYAADGVHMNALGYAAVAQTWDNAILQDVTLTAAEVVPEPSIWCLLTASGILAFAFHRLRRKQAA